MPAEKAKGPDDYWLKPGFARRYVLREVQGMRENKAAREFDALCFMAMAQGIQYLCPMPHAVLDAGCGHAERAMRLKANAPEWRIVGADYSDAFLEIAREIMAQLPKEHGVELVKADVNSLPFSDGEFDVCIARGLLMSLDKPEQPIQELLRVVKYGLVMIDEYPAAMDEVMRDYWRKTNEERQPGRVWWHDPLRLLNSCKSVIFTPLRPPPDWDLGEPPGYARVIAVKAEYQPEVN